MNGTYLSELEHAVHQLSAAMEVVKGSMLEHGTAGSYPEIFLQQDPNGRYVFLDAQTALVNGLCALVNAEQEIDALEKDPAVLSDLRAAFREIGDEAMATSHRTGSTSEPSVWLP